MLSSQCYVKLVLVLSTVINIFLFNNSRKYLVPFQFYFQKDTIY